MNSNGTGVRFPLFTGVNGGIRPRPGGIFRSVLPMIPADISFLTGQLAGTGVAFTDSGLADPDLAVQLSGLVAGESTAVVVAGPGHGAAMRDLGQAVLDMTDFSTVIVRGPGGGVAVSEDYSRAAIEAAQPALAAEPDYVAGVAAFGDAVESFSVNWTLAGMVGMVLLALVLLLAGTAARRSTPQG